MREIGERAAFAPTIFTAVPGEVPVDGLRARETANTYLSAYERYKDTAVSRFNDFYSEHVKLRTGDGKAPKDRVTIVIDSSADPAAMYTLAWSARINGVEDVSLVYARTNYHDVGRVAQLFFEAADTQTPEELRIPITYVDAVRPQDVDIEGIFRNRSLVITSIADSYDLRRRINEYAAAANYSVPEMPTLDMAACLSPAFSVSRSEMERQGNAVKDVVNRMRGFRITAPDGTNLTVTTGSFINEAANDFTRRPYDYDTPDTKLPVPVQDNFPAGEVWANTHGAEGTLVLYQIDTEVLKWAARNPALSGVADLSPGALHEAVYDPRDPIRLTIRNGVIERIEGGKRARILDAYLAEQGKLDGNKERKNDAPKMIAELAWGINAGAGNPETPVAPNVYTTSVLVTEKAAKVPHIAFGGSPDLSPEEMPFVHTSDTHFDNGLRNPDLRIYGIEQNGTTTLLTSTAQDETGVIDRILDGDAIFTGSAKGSAHA